MEHNDIIKALGGVAELARTLKESPNTVQAWQKRGFPDWFRADHQKLIRKGKKLAGIK
jgi:hypothetical protein